jgi:hypothetical protein
MVGQRYLLTQVSGNKLPTRYYRSPSQDFDVWVDSAWVTFQPDNTVVLHMYRRMTNYGDTSGSNGSTGQGFSGNYTVSRGTIVTYANGGPDTATFIPGGGIEIPWASHYPDEIIPLGRWLFNKRGRTHNPLPSIRRLSPDTVSLNASEFELTLEGYGFLPGTYVYVGGMHLLPFEQSLTRARVRVPLTFVQAGDLNVRVSNPAPGGGSSSVAVVTVLPRTE